MIIKRIINGEPTEIELTETELCDAYKEQQHIFDMDDVRHYWEYDEMDEDGRTRFTDEQISDIAYRSREMQDYSDTILDTIWNCVDAAITEYAKDSGVKLEV